MSSVGGAQGEAVYQCDGHVTFASNILSTWRAVQNGYTVCASGCELCTASETDRDAATDG